MGTRFSDNLNGVKLRILDKCTYQKGESAPWFHRHNPGSFLRAAPQSHHGPRLLCDLGSYSWNHGMPLTHRPRPQISLKYCRPTRSLKGWRVGVNVYRDYTFMKSFIFLSIGKIFFFLWISISFFFIEFIIFVPSIFEIIEWLTSPD